MKRIFKIMLYFFIFVLASAGITCVIDVFNKDEIVVDNNNISNDLNDDNEDSVIDEDDDTSIEDTTTNTDSTTDSETSTDGTTTEDTSSTELVKQAVVFNTDLTTIDETDYVDKVRIMFDCTKSIDEVLSILNSLTFVDDIDGDYINVFYCKYEDDSWAKIRIMYFDLENYYAIIYDTSNNDGEPIFVSNEEVAAAFGIDWVGWIYDGLGYGYSFLNCIPYPQNYNSVDNQQELYKEIIYLEN